MEKEPQDGSTNGHNVAEQNRTGPQSRRQFLKLLGLSASATGILSTAAVDASSPDTDIPFDPAVKQADGLSERATAAYRIRSQAAARLLTKERAPRITNGDETRYANYAANFSKALPHNRLGEVDVAAYKVLLRAVKKGRPGLVEKIPLGGKVKLVNPLGAVAFQLEAADSHAYTIPVPPAFASEEQAAELAENYWLALVRDVPYSDYAASDVIEAALSDLNAFPTFAGLTPATIFRGTTAGDRVGPYISQFLWVDVPYGATTITQKYLVSRAREDFLIDYAEWLHVQNGNIPNAKLTLVNPARYIYNSRALGEWVHKDFPCQAFLNAALILLSYGPQALADTNPYKLYRKQSAFATFGGPDVLDLVSRVANYALKAAWYQKWMVHRRIRPEAYAGRVHTLMSGQARYPIPAALLNSTAIARIGSMSGGYLLPMAYPEGCPVHPAYPAGHATVAGACTTVLKALFNEDFLLAETKIATTDGRDLVDFNDVPLTLGGELNKLASNITRGRDAAGVHWRSDGIEGLRLGEAVALSLLTDMRKTYRERFPGFSLRTFDGTTVKI